MNGSRAMAFVSMVLALYFLSGERGPINAAEGGANNKLPVKELRAPSPSLPVLTVFLAGDGGWAKIDRDISRVLNQHGMDVLGFNSLEYFIKNRSPEESATDIGHLARYYLEQWNKKGIIMIGYSRGADVLPFVISRFPDDLRNKVRMIVLLAPSTTAGFKFHLGQWFGIETKDSRYPLVPEIAKLPPSATVCFCGDQENDSLCNEPAVACNKILITGRHHFNRDYHAMGERIWMEYQKRSGDPLRS